MRCVCKCWKFVRAASHKFESVNRLVILHAGLEAMEAERDRGKPPQHSIQPCCYRRRSRYRHNENSRYKIPPCLALCVRCGWGRCWWLFFVPAQAILKKRTTRRSDPPWAPSPPTSTTLPRAWGWWPSCSTMRTTVTTYWRFAVRATLVAAPLFCDCQTTDSNSMGSILGSNVVSSRCLSQGISI